MIHPQTTHSPAGEAAQPETKRALELGASTGYAHEYRDLTCRDKLQVGDEGLVEGKWVPMAAAFAGHYYIPKLMSPMRRRVEACVSRIPTRPRCHRCERYITIDTHADDDLWEEVIGPRFGPGYICADCFTRAADERLIEWEGRVRFLQYSLAKQMRIQAEAADENERRFAEFTAKVEQTKAAFRVHNPKLSGAPRPL